MPCAFFALLQEKGLEAVPLLADGNLVDQAWGADRPGLPTAPLRVHAAEWAGASIQQKVDEVSTSRRMQLGVNVLAASQLVC